VKRRRQGRALSSSAARQRRVVGGGRVTLRHPCSTAGSLVLNNGQGRIAFEFGTDNALSKMALPTKRFGIIEAGCVNGRCPLHDGQVKDCVCNLPEAPEIRRLG
jgi:hypothetical protein